MTCTSNNEYFELSEQTPISFTQWKAILSQLKQKETAK